MQVHVSGILTGIAILLIPEHESGAVFGVVAFPVQTTIGGAPAEIGAFKPIAFIKIFAVKTFNNLSHDVTAECDIILLRVAALVLRKYFSPLCLSFVRGFIVLVKPYRVFYGQALPELLHFWTCPAKIRIANQCYKQRFHC